VSALAEALLAAQRQAIGSLSKAFVAGKISGEQLTDHLTVIGCTDAVDQTLLLDALTVLQTFGGEAPKPTQTAPRSTETDLETEAQRKLIAKLADDRGTTAPDYKLTKANASRVIEELKAGTYSPDAWQVPF
jgi:hypothetical protein